MKFDSVRISFPLHVYVRAQKVSEVKIAQAGCAGYLHWRLSQEDYKSRDWLGYKVSSSPAWATLWELASILKVKRRCRHSFVVGVFLSMCEVLGSVPCPGHRAGRWGCFPLGFDPRGRVSPKGRTALSCYNIFRCCPLSLILLNSIQIKSTDVISYPFHCIMPRFRNFAKCGIGWESYNFYKWNHG